RPTPIYPPCLDDALPICDDVDVLEALVGGEARPGQERDVGSRGRDDRLEGVVGEVAGVEDAAVVEVEGVPGEGGVAGDDPAAGEDRDGARVDAGHGRAAD